jgi:poly-gamma-glutamate capsule biosynthesis protein CapA/YwtB (metallophosphatase superfamily)
MIPVSIPVTTLALAGDTMLGRKVAERLAVMPPDSLFADEVRMITNEADLFVVNLECAISDRGERWPDPRKPYFFRAPPAATEVLQHLGVDCVTLANNHALDFGTDALLDTLHHLAAAGIAATGAGADVDAARAPALLSMDGLRVGIVSVTDHPRDFQADEATPGVAYADLGHEVPGWLNDVIARLDTDIVVVSPHWGPNMVDRPLGYVRRAADALRAAGAHLVAGHSAHVFHGVGDAVLYDLGDFIDDYAIDADLRNDLGLLWVVTFTGRIPTRVEAVPLALDYCHTRLARGAELDWIERRFRDACAAFGTEVTRHDGRLVVEWDRPAPVRRPAP